MDELDAHRIIEWLDMSGESDPEMRRSVLNQCRQVPEARKYFLMRWASLTLTTEYRVYSELERANKLKHNDVGPKAGITIF